MGKTTGIAWCDATFNAWWGCQKVSPGCAHCYAETWAKRYGHAVWGTSSDRRVFGERHWAEPIAWDRVAARDGVRMRVFCGSMCDVFEDHPGLDGLRGKLWDLIGKTANLDWLLLTKRPENIAGMCGVLGAPNVWLGTSAEDQDAADRRIPDLARLPAAVRFLSLEPLLGPIELGLAGTTPRDWGYGYRPVGELIHWVIVGGESGAGCRPMNWEWVRAIAAECTAAAVPLFVKQRGGHPDKGDDPRDWPEDLRVRELPARPVGEL
jgi:protein gp37